MKSPKFLGKSNALACAATFLLLCANAAVGSPTFQYKLPKPALSKPAVSISSSGDGKKTVFLVTDASGIGRATVALSSGQWPEQVTLRFRYGQGRGFRRLEGWSLTTAHLQVRGGMADSGKMPFRFLGAGGGYDAQSAAAGEMNILVEERNKAMEVTLPPNLFSGSKEVEIEWIDAYR